MSFAISLPEPTCRLVRVLALTKRHLGSVNEIVSFEEVGV